MAKLMISQTQCGNDKSYDITDSMRKLVTNMKINNKSCVYNAELVWKYMVLNPFSLKIMKK